MTIMQRLEKEFGIRLVDYYGQEILFSEAMEIIAKEYESLSKEDRDKLITILLEESI